MSNYHKLMSTTLTEDNLEKQIKVCEQPRKIKNNTDRNYIERKLLSKYSNYQIELARLGVKHKDISNTGKVHSIRHRLRTSGYSLERENMWLIPENEYPQVMLTEIKNDCEQYRIYF